MITIVIITSTLLLKKQQQEQTTDHLHELLPLQVPSLPVPSELLVGAPQLGVGVSQLHQVVLQVAHLAKEKQRAGVCCTVYVYITTYVCTYCTVPVDVLVCPVLSFFFLTDLNYL